MKAVVFVIAISFCMITSGAVPSNAENRQGISRVVVIGGGVSGLTAAARLHSAGFNVTLLEAMDRIGGRTYTLKLDGQHTELGGEWVHGEEGNSVWELVHPLGLLKPRSKDLNLSAYPGGFAFQNGEILNDTVGKTIWEMVNYMGSDPENWGADLEENLSMGQVARFILDKFNEAYPSNSDGVFTEAVYDFAHRATLAEDASDNWFEKSATDEGEQYVELEGDQKVAWKSPYSYSSLHQLILTGNVTEAGIYELPEWIKLNTEVVRIEYSQDTNIVKVSTRDGTMYTAEHVVFTPSLGVLKANHKQLFEPQLSQKKQLTIENIGFGTVVKYAMEFEKPWWPEDYEGTFFLWNDHNYKNKSLDYWRSDLTKEELMVEYDGLPLWTRSILSLFPVDSGSAPKILRIWLSGKPSRYLEEMDPNYVQKTVMRVIHRFLDNLFPNITNPKRIFQSKWASNPFTRGTYSFRSMDSESFDVWARDLAEPILNSINQQPIICFAGEATHREFFATVHGAYETGLREFERISTWYSTKNGPTATANGSNKELMYRLILLSLVLIILCA